MDKWILPANEYPHAVKNLTIWSPSENIHKETDFVDHYYSNIWNTIKEVFCEASPLCATAMSLKAVEYAVTIVVTPQWTTSLWSQ